jgi:hypothetical protein
MDLKWDNCGAVNSDRLGYKTPFEVFAKMTGKDYFLNGSVALMG